MSSERPLYFPLYAREFLTDAKLKTLSDRHIVQLIRLWCYQTIEGELPGDLRELAALIDVPFYRFQHDWAILSPFFEARTVPNRAVCAQSVRNLCANSQSKTLSRDRLVALSPRLERELTKINDKLDARRQHARIAAEARWSRPQIDTTRTVPTTKIGDNEANARALPEHCSSTATGNKNKKIIYPPPPPTADLTNKPPDGGGGGGIEKADPAFEMWREMQRLRKEAGLRIEERRPRATRNRGSFDQWCRQLLDQTSATAILLAYRDYLLDAGIRNETRPTSLFMVPSVYETRLQAAPAAVPEKTNGHFTASGTLPTDLIAELNAAAQSANVAIGDVWRLVLEKKESGYAKEEAVIEVLEELRNRPRSGGIEPNSQNASERIETPRPSNDLD